MGSAFSYHSVVIFTDVSEEIDDQLLLLWLHTNCTFSATFTIVFCPTNDNTSEHGRSLWVDTYLPHSSTTSSNANASTFKYMTLEEFSIIPEVVFQYGLVIAPLKGYSGNNLTIERAVFIQGSQREKSFNTITSGAFITKFKKKFQLIEIPSSACAKMRPHGSWLASLPKFYQEQVSFVGFKLLVGRMGTGIIVREPVMINISQAYAEGLVNPKVKSFASNYMAAKSLLEIFTGESIDTEMSTLVPDLIHEEVARKYMADIFGEPDCPSRTLAKDYDGSTICVAKMCKVLDIVSSTDMFTDRGEVYYSDFDHTLNGDPVLIGAYSAFTSCLGRAEGMINFLNPVYDLFAGFVAIEYIKTGVYSAEYTPEAFFEMIM